MRKKKISFIIIIILLPVIIFILLETILYAINYDNSNKTVIIIKRNGGKYYTINQLVGERYFNKKKLYYRKGQHDYFEVKKSSKTLRIFCFGASTTAGFPYEYNAIPTEFLRRQLVTLLLNKNIEVINTAIAATNSFTVLDLEKELIKYQPDLFIIYMGQNEFYGAFGVGSSISLGQNRTLIKTHLWLHKFRTYLLIKNIITSVLTKNKDKKENTTLMEDMIQNNSIPLDSKKYITAKETFKKNYEEIIELAKRNNIPAIISTLVTNKSDLPPFVSLHNKNIDKNKLRRFNNFYNSGLKNFEDKNYKDALNFFNKAIQIDSLYAKAHYYLGKCFDALKNYFNAKKEFTLANDLDGLKFRAPSEFNSIIKSLSRTYKIPLADVLKTFEANSPNKLIGNKLLIDHLHPNIKGYFLLSRTWINAIKNNYLLGLKPTDEVSERTFWKNIPITELDSTIGEIKIMKLKSKPPFQARGENFIIKPKNFTEQQAYRLTIKNEISWGVAHFYVAKHYFENKLYIKAINELKAILVTDKNNTDVLTMIGDAYFLLNDFSNAEKIYLKIYSLRNNTLDLYKLGTIELKLNKPENAIPFLRNCIRKMPNRTIDVRFMLATAYFETNKISLAKNELRLLLQQNPNNKKALNLLFRIKENEKK